MFSNSELYATCGTGLESLLAVELELLGLPGVRSAGAGAGFGGGLAAGYKACLWSRVANRILLPIHRGTASSPDVLYALVQEIDWSTHLDVDGTLAVDFFTAKSTITHSQYGALKTKDAVVDQFRERLGRRPSVERTTPDLRINVYLFRDKARIAIDLSGSSLHRRGYRDAGGLAPFKENLAAAMLLSAGWPELAARGRPLVDPLCGSGTLLIEAALMACNRAPGLLRDYFGFQGWKAHDPVLWQTVRAEAIAAEWSQQASITGFDHDAEAIENCRRNLARAGLADRVSVEQRPLSGARSPLPKHARQGLVVSNPPYGERLAVDAAFYSSLGSALSRDYAGWRCALFTAQEAPYAKTRLPLTPSLQVKNGGIDCVLLTGDIPRAGRQRQGHGGSHGQPVAAMNAVGVWDAPDVSYAPVAPDAVDVPDAERAADAAESAELEVHPQASLYRTTRKASGVDANVSVTSGGAETGSGTKDTAAEGSAAEGSATKGSATKGSATKGSATEGSVTTGMEVDATPFANRLKKNRRALKGWKRQNDIHAYRVYDADLPEFAVAVDLYEADRLHCVVQEYLAPATVNLAMAEARLHALLDILPETLQVDPDCVHLKVREVRSGRQQYGKLPVAASSVAWVNEFGASLLVNFTDYLDTGLFLDHRPVRRYIASHAQGRRFLNLFAYTGAATVAAVIGGAQSSVSVDTSNSYCQWALRNLERNHASLQRHEVVRQDVFSWLRHAATGIRDDARFDLILLDPPTFSNSTSLQEDWNVQRDHVSAIDACLNVLAPGGTLIFSNNFRRFRLDPELTDNGARGIDIEDRSKWSIDRDFQRNQRIHQCWFIRKR